MFLINGNDSNKLGSNFLEKFEDLSVYLEKLSVGVFI
jgi:hypothetical protein